MATKEAQDERTDTSDVLDEEYKSPSTV